MNQPTITEENARSTTHRSAKAFVKTSQELSLANEASELKRCEESRICTPHVRTPECLGFEESTNRLITRPVHGSQTLFNRLWNETSIAAKCCRRGIDLDTFFFRIEEIGRWLGMYHGTTDHSGEASTVSQVLLQTFRAKFDYVRVNRLLDEPFLEHLESKLCSEIEKLGDSKYQQDNSVRFCRVHGDFIANNMVVDEGWNIYILDFADTHVGASTEDIGRFYQLFWAMSQTSAFRRQIFSKALDIFLHSYGFPKGIHDSPLLKSIRALNVIIHLISEHSARPYIRRQILTRLSFKRISTLSIRWLKGEWAA